MTWNKLFSNPRKEYPRVVISFLGERTECDIIEEALAITNDTDTWPTGFKPSGRYWLRRRSDGRMILPKALPR